MVFFNNYPVSALQVYRTARVNGYTGRSATGQEWQTYSKRFITFGREGIKGGTFRATSAPQNPDWKAGGDTSRKLLRSVEVDDGLSEISYPIGVGDTCDCVVLPDISTAEVEECDYSNNPPYWGVFGVISTANDCYNYGFDTNVVYANCPSSLSWETVTEYVLCEIDFNEGIPDGESMIDDPTTAPSTGAAGGWSVSESTTTKEKLGPNKKEVASDTSISLHQKTKVAAKTTRIHLSIHRLLTLFVEAVFALQSTSN